MYVLDIAKNTAQNIKRIRERKKLTLDAAANITGVSRSMLSQIERGDANPTITVLWKIANGFKVSFTSLTECIKEETAVIRATSIEGLSADEGRYHNYPLFQFDEKHLFEVYRIVIEPQGMLQAQPHIAGTEEYITVFQGSVEITVDKQKFNLSMGDAIRFKSDLPHSYRNLGQDIVQLSMLIYYAPN